MTQIKTITVRFTPPASSPSYISYLRNGAVNTTGIVLDTYHSQARDEGIVNLRALTSRGQLATGDLQLPTRAMDELALSWLRLRHGTLCEIVPFTDDGSQCPVCGSWDIAGDDVSTGTEEANQEMHCHGCGATWTQVYISAGYSDLVRGENPGGQPGDGDAAHE